MKDLEKNINQTGLILHSYKESTTLKNKQQFNIEAILRKWKTLTGSIQY